ncbi:TetR/AcrR family transcriptional regulator [Nocardia vermiculata]|uniref:TetR/AcrR family transcriptional regulator n=1 Tax=Nocardia vermiculata TaxID=257274 RepID=A0A846Y9G6_9NOCA|nr:TetR/AcrR family transcriptional regulator [Nocardia vermiculata]NKY53878.1 TetR/AcrR family transcriptional regulator [Nocardia vermiculata]
MPRPVNQDRRAELLAGVIAYIGEYGLIELSLRPLADYLGTSSRMLIHYFGTKEQMLVAALETQRPDIVGMFAGVPDLPSLRRKLIESFSVNITSEWMASTRALHQVLGAATVPGSPFASYAEDVVSTLVAALADALRELEPTVPDPESTATVLVSGVRGLLQHRMLTGDTARVSRAARLLITQSLSVVSAGE